jgi:molybdate transport system ATP-binding protein
MLLSLSDATIRVGESECFPGTNWEMKIAEKWAVLGPTGSGKTVLARAISRQYSLSTGQIRFYFDQEVHPTGRSYLLPGEILIFSAETHQQFLQSFSAYHQARWQSFEGEDAPLVSELLDPARIHAHSPYEVSATVSAEPFKRQKELLLKLFGIVHLLSRKIHLLSHGESRKVFLTYLLLRSPKMLILDDPFAGLDEETRKQFQDNLEDFFQAIHQPVLFLTSRAEDLPSSISHLLLIDNLHVIDQGKRSEVKWSVPSNKIFAPAAAFTPSASVIFKEMVAQYASALEEKAVQSGNQVIEMRAVSVGYDSVEVLKNINWVVQRGERWALRGANGAGKTTLLSLILGDNPQAYRNHISLFGKLRGSGESIWQIKQRIGWVSPELQIFYDRTVTCLDVVNSGFFNSIGLYHQCTPDQAAVSYRWMRALEIDSLAHQPLFSLSTGQQRLVLLARALVKQPPLLILDEPCQGLDNQHRRDFTQLVDQLCENTPLTLIYVTHYRDELPGSINHQLILDNGELLQIT